MKRSTFIKSLILGGAGAAYVGNNYHEFLKEYPKVYHNYVRGLQYYKYKSVAKHLREGGRLFLKREPKNRYDKCAIGVYYNSMKLGYLPRDENKVLANLMDLGKPAYARIKKLNSNEDELYKAVFVEVFADVG
ncbi:MAG: hiran domain protein [Chitinophagaceae bacterium]|nr:MAG: hiran domain protein [Chitinophagaceae bacterium]